MCTSISCGLILKCGLSSFATNGIFSIDLGGLNLLGNSMVKVFDYTGREILIFNSIESILQLDISEYHSGIYFISVMNNGVYYYDRILKK